MSKEFEVYRIPNDSGLTSVEPSIFEGNKVEDFMKDSCKPPYVTLTVHRSQLELLKYSIGSLDRPNSVAHLPEQDRDVVAHVVQDFYQLICDELDKKSYTVPSNKNEYAKLTDEEEKLLKECFED